MRRVMRDAYTVRTARLGCNLKIFVAAQRIPPGRLSLFMKFYFDWRSDSEVTERKRGRTKTKRGEKIEEKRRKQKEEGKQG